MVQLTTARDQNEYFFCGVVVIAVYLQWWRSELGGLKHSINKADLDFGGFPLPPDNRALDLLTNHHGLPTLLVKVMNHYGCKMPSALAAYVVQINQSMAGHIFNIITWKKIVLGTEHRYPA
ncbi:hypothetical protein ACRALDRAFT_206889 [Sodiomyces alcalophilus JCM 7366]|uniref:uncharacterized protein n=1 Tax=Sodiomyces alcalophilus JCM 7366 TaxID=591952 RepID=UPI0039B67AAD